MIRVTLSLAFIIIGLVFICIAAFGVAHHTTAAVRVSVGDALAVTAALAEIRRTERDRRRRGHG